MQIPGVHAKLGTGRRRSHRPPMRSVAAATMVVRPPATWDLHPRLPHAVPSALKRRGLHTFRFWGGITHRQAATAKRGPQNVCEGPLTALAGGGIEKACGNFAEKYFLMRLSRVFSFPKSGYITVRVLLARLPHLGSI
jgi:hypothetical protein